MNVLYFKYTTETSLCAANYTRLKAGAQNTLRVVDLSSSIDHLLNVSPALNLLSSWTAPSNKAFGAKEHPWKNIWHLFLEQHDASTRLNRANLSVLIHCDHEVPVHHPLLTLTRINQQIRPGIHPNFPDVKYFIYKFENKKIYMNEFYPCWKNEKLTLMGMW